MKIADLSLSLFYINQQFTSRLRPHGQPPPPRLPPVPVPRFNINYARISFRRILSEKGGLPSQDGKSIVYSSTSLFAKFKLDDPIPRPRASFRRYVRELSFSSLFGGGKFRGLTFGWLWAPGHRVSREIKSMERSSISS